MMSASYDGSGGAGASCSQGSCGARAPVSTSVQRTGYMGFGSFMVDRSVEDMIREPDSTYSPPPHPFPQPSIKVDTTTPLGQGLRHLFLIDFASWTFVNHGAFGGVCTPAHQEAALWREHAERQPLRFLDRELFPHLVRVMRDLAAFVNAQPQDLVLLPNATTGLNVVIQSAGLKTGTALYMLDIGYGSVKKMAAAACDGAQVVYGTVPFPLQDEEAVVQLVADTMPDNTRLAVFDAVTSNTAIVLPIKRLIRLCHDRGVKVLIDAAHALGQLEVDLTDLDADYYVSNCHKWLSAPRGSATMWVHPRCQPSVRPLVVSHGSGAGFVSDFVWDGCRDYAPYLGISAALRLWRQLGPERCRTYMRGLLRDAVALLTAGWGTDTLVPLSLCGAMALVRLPAGPAVPIASATSVDAKFVQDVLYHHHAVECPVKCIGGGLYVRVSAAVYNVLSDYETLRDAVLALVQQPPPLPVRDPVDPSAQL